MTDLSGGRIPQAWLAGALVGLESQAEGPVEQVQLACQ